MKFRYFYYFCEIRFKVNYLKNTYMMKTNLTKISRSIYESPSVEVAEMVSSSVLCSSVFDENSVKDYDYSDRNIW